MSDYEWAHATDPAEVVPPDELAELADDGNPRGEWGVCVSTGSNGVMIYGSPAQLRRLLLQLHNALPPAPENVGASVDVLPNRPGR